MTNDSNESKSCSGFNYCFWAKAIVGIPVLVILANIAAQQFHDEFMKYVAVAVTLFVLIWVAKKIETAPGLSKKICAPKK